ncbi:DUF2971 domain-containing protein [Agrobacterium sp. S2]|nr:DUF2971 domain-containing protein [Agrobacterium sp. S2]
MRDFAKLRETIAKQFETQVESMRTVTHYTSLEGLCSIIQNHQLWASNVRFLNDEQELKYGVDTAISFLEEEVYAADDPASNFLSTHIDRLRDSLLNSSLPPIYACCFCETRDNLSLWRGYSKGGQPIAIDFNVGLLQQHLNAKIVPVSYGQGDTRKALQRAYAQWRTEFEGMAAQDAANLESHLEALRNVVFTLAPQFKHPGFAGEQEWRLIVERPSGDQIQYRTRDYVIVPYVTIGTEEVPLPIDTIRIGPGKNMELTKSSVEMLLQSNPEYAEIEVELSNVPFRT